MSERPTKQAASAAPNAVAAADTASGAGGTGTPREVHVRMYRGLEAQRDYKGWLGDCFLIRLLGENGAKSHILIDCGILLGSPNAKLRAQMVADDIVRTTGGTLDLLVVTHEHWDHISGFSQAAGTFLGTKANNWTDGTLRIGKVWMAWTENPDDPQARDLRARFDKAGTSFAAFAEYLDQRKRAGTLPLGLDPGQALMGLDGFLGVRGANGALQGREIMDALKQVAEPAYPEPGTVLETPAADPAGPVLRAYVLGPPRNEARLFKDKPSTGAAQETYLDMPTFGNAMQRLLGVGDDGSSQDQTPCADSPFAAFYCKYPDQPIAEAAEKGAPPSDDTRRWLYERYYCPPGADPARQAAADRRRIDGDWLAAAGPLALKLDSDTNNTSLALAFDLPDGTAMLFAADAQVGNWLSWHDQTYKRADGSEQSAEQILNRVRFYKVGHHGSHNATMREKGLEMMTRSDLVAAIPTDEELGDRQGRGGWQMPNPRVYDELLKRTAGRIMRNDRNYDPASRQNDPELKDVEVGFFDRLVEEPLFLEYRVL